MDDRGQRTILLSYNLTKTSVSQHLGDRACQGLAVDSSGKENETKRFRERSREGETEQREDWGKAKEREQAVLAGPWLRARPQLFMRQCTCQEPTDKHNSKAERKSNSASVGNAHNAPGGTHLGAFLCCSWINREQGYLSTAWFSSRAKSSWNSLSLFFWVFFIFTCVFFGRGVGASGFLLFMAH